MTYNADSIVALSDIEGIRKRPGMYVGSVNLAGIHHLITEILSNSIDEKLNGYGDLVTYEVQPDGYIRMTDNGRGMPVGINKQGIEAFFAALTMTHAGGKFNNDGDEGYNTSGGMNGVGLKAVNGLSEHAIFISCRDGYKHTYEFKCGELQGEMKKEKSNEVGTTIIFKPDSQIFEEGITPDNDTIKALIQEFAYLTKGLEFRVIEGEKVTTLKSENGLIDYIDDLNKGKKVITKTLYMDSESDIGSVELAMTYNTGTSNAVKLYTNNIPNTEGRHYTGFKTALTRVANKVARANGTLKEKDENFSGDDLREGLSLVISIKIVDPQFSGQTKELLDDKRGRTLVEKAFGEFLTHYLETNKKEAKTIFTKAKTAQKARLAAKKARDMVNRKSAVSGGGVSLPGKLSDCISKKANETEIYIVEGDSAGGSAKQGRNKMIQAIMSLRGKVINAEKNDLGKLLKNKEIADMISAFGCGVSDSFNISKLRYGKVIIMTDADVDGSHIRVLLLTFLFRYMYPLIENGHVYCAMPPLYKVYKGKKVKYAYTETEKDQLLKEIPGASIQRYKGLTTN